MENNVKKNICEIYIYINYTSMNLEQKKRSHGLLKIYVKSGNFFVQTDPLTSPFHSEENEALCNACPPSSHCLPGPGPWMEERRPAMGPGGRDPQAPQDRSDSHGVGPRLPPLALSLGSSGKGRGLGAGEGWGGGCPASRTGWGRTPPGLWAVGATRGERVC